MMHNPPHPGGVIRRLCMEPLKLSVTETAAKLDISRKTLSALLNQRAGISPAMAIRLAAAFGGSPESWLRQQAQYDLAQTETRYGKILRRRVRRISRAAAGDGFGSIP